jgi:4-nitrophenyl phosphatase
MTRASVAIRRGARLVATNDDATYPTPDGPIPGGGAILASIVTASGAVPVVAGKPHRPITDLVRARLGPTGICVGDRPDTDGGFAVALGYRFGLVLSGVTGAADLPVTPPADVVAPDLRTLVAQELAAWR